MRLDLYLFLSGAARSRTHAVNLIKLGAVSVNGKIETKASREVTGKEDFLILNENDYASLGGAKLSKALKEFAVDIKGKTAIDIGASNGGFTDVLLRAGAAKVYAVDVGECALPRELSDDVRVEVKDRLNARYITFEDIGIKADIITIDVSFISLKLIIPPLLQFFKEDTLLVALIKPQFEAGKKALSKSGIVTDEKVRKKVIDDISGFVSSLGLKVIGKTDAPHPFKEKNKEYLILAEMR